jgi:hypothetical protein
LQVTSLIVKLLQRFFAGLGAGFLGAGLDDFAPCAFLPDRELAGGAGARFAGADLAWEGFAGALAEGLAGSLAGALPAAGFLAAGRAALLPLAATGAGAGFLTAGTALALAGAGFGLACATGGFAATPAGFAGGTGFDWVSGFFFGSGLDAG